ncbi:MAG TPA: hypothetical protein VFE31_04655 [Opitutaceae bacterium]|jgi:uncharacterized membrane protein HdeD (DUF308 family)|nr:hypothetical protein [Opitutaceae bacterium]
MSRILLALFLLVFGINMLCRLTVPLWLLGLLAVLAGALQLMEHFRIRLDRK